MFHTERVEFDTKWKSNLVFKFVLFAAIKFQWYCSLLQYIKRELTFFWLFVFTMPEVITVRFNLCQFPWGRITEKCAPEELLFTSVANKKQGILWLVAFCQDQKVLVIKETEVVFFTSSSSVQDNLAHLIAMNNLFAVCLPQTLCHNKLL